MIYIKAADNEKELNMNINLKNNHIAAFATSAKNVLAKGEFDHE